MKITRIYSNRSYEQWPSWHLVHEWEEDFSQVFKAPITNSRLKENIFDNKLIKRFTSNGLIRSIFQKSDKLFDTDEKALIFEMLPKSYFSYSTSTNVLPIIIDFWMKQNLENFYNTYRNCKLIGISSLEAYNFLKDQNCPLNIIHLPLSLSDRYRLKGNEIFNKKYDIILAGRRNKILWEYLTEFAGKHKEIEFLYQEKIKGRLFYVSNKKGVLGEFHKRDEYIELLKSCRIGFYATPGMDGSKETGGFNPVTARFLELIAAGCHVLGRYPNNEETEFYKVEHICPNINSYRDFETTVLQYLDNTGPSLKLYSEFLKDHYTSNRAYQLKNSLDKLN